MSCVSELESEIINFYPDDADLLYLDLREVLLYIGKNKILDNYELHTHGYIEYR